MCSIPPGRTFPSTQVPVSAKWNNTMTSPACSKHHKQALPESSMCSQRLSNSSVLQIQWVTCVQFFTIWECLPRVLNSCPCLQISETLIFCLPFGKIRTSLVYGNKLKNKKMSFTQKLHVKINSWSWVCSSFIFVFQPWCSPTVLKQASFFKYHFLKK